MTGVLSTIEPGTFTQLTAGLMMATIYTAVLCKLEPYQEARDNNIAILSSALIEATFISSYLMKSQEMVEDGFEATGLGVLLVTATVLIGILFLLWAYNAIYDLNRSSTAQITDLMKQGLSTRVGFSTRFGSARSRGGKSSSSRGKSASEADATSAPVSKSVSEASDAGVELSNMEGEEEGRKSSFVSSNPMLKKSGTGSTKSRIMLAQAGRPKADEWERFVQEETGHEYFFNNTTGETSWTKPESFGGEC